jgi:uncharacterized protein with PIN domain
MANLFSCRVDNRFGVDSMAERNAKFIPQPAFVAESTLGKLSTWLRLAGFDTLYDPLPPNWRRLRGFADSENRKVLSRTQRVMRQLAVGQGLFIRFDAPIEQMRQVIRYFHIRRNDLRPLTRCSRCNYWLQPADQAHIQNGVPDFVRERYERFMICSRCGRIYWPGTHSSRMADLFERWFCSIGIEGD